MNDTLYPSSEFDNRVVSLNEMNSVNRDNIQDLFLPGYCPSDNRYIPCNSNRKSTFFTTSGSASIAMNNLQ